MAEGLARARFGESVTVQSAGVRPAIVHPLAIRAMAEVGIDISSHRSKSVLEVDPFLVDLVVTLCDDQVCPRFLGASRKIHWPLPDPCVTAGLIDDLLTPFREIRDEIGRRLGELDLELELEPELS